jgi:hypothetical protein
MNRSLVPNVDDTFARPRSPTPTGTTKYLTFNPDPRVDGLIRQGKQNCAHHEDWDREKQSFSFAQTQFDL